MSAYFEKLIEMCGR